MGGVGRCERADEETLQAVEATGSFGSRVNNRVSPNHKGARPAVQGNPRAAARTLSIPALSGVRSLADAVQRCAKERGRPSCRFRLHS